MAGERHPVWIELTYAVTDLFLTPPNEHYQVAYPLDAIYEGPHRVTVTVEPVSAVEADHALRNDAVAKACGQLNASPRVAAMLSDLACGLAPVGSQLPPQDSVFAVEPWFDAATRVIQSGAGGAPLDLLPEAVRSFITQAGGELRDYLIRTVRVMRWRQAAEGPHSPFVGHSGRFSLDGETWHPLPASYTGSLSMRGSLSFRGSEWQEVVDLVAQGLDEPFSFELHREAWNQRSGNPRSALLLGVAAAEVGFKECVVKLAPDAAWLVLKVPAPPLVRMLNEYLPKLPARNLIGGKVVPPPATHLKRLTRGVEARNELAHRGGVTPSSDEVTALLVTIEEILWILSYYAGRAWALQHVSLETRAALGVELSVADQESLHQRGLAD
jgi:hypothetical protein